MTLIQLLEATRKALTTREVAELLGVSKQHVYEMAADGGLPAFHLGRSIRFDPQELADWMRRRKPEVGQTGPERSVQGKDRKIQANSGKKGSGSVHRDWRHRVNQLEAAAAIEESAESATGA